MSYVYWIQCLRCKLYTQIHHALVDEWLSCVAVVFVVIRSRERVRVRLNTVHRINDKKRVFRLQRRTSQMIANAIGPNIICFSLFFSPRFSISRMHTCCAHMCTNVVDVWNWFCSFLPIFFLFLVCQSVRSKNARIFCWTWKWRNAVNW